MFWPSRNDTDSEDEGWGTVSSSGSELDAGDDSDGGDPDYPDPDVRGRTQRTNGLKYPILTPPDPALVTCYYEPPYVGRNVLDNVNTRSHETVNATGIVSHRETIISTGEEYYVVRGCVLLLNHIISLFALHNKSVIYLLLLFLPINHSKVVFKNNIGTFHYTENELKHALNGAAFLLTPNDYKNGVRIIKHTLREAVAQSPVNIRTGSVSFSVLKT